jgi:hypothetical protein
MDAGQRAMIGIDLMKALAAAAKARQREAGGDRKSPSAKSMASDQKSLPPKSGEAKGEFSASTVQQAQASSPSTLSRYQPLSICSAVSADPVMDDQSTKPARGKLAFTGGVAGLVWWLSSLFPSFGRFRRLYRLAANSNASLRISCGTRGPERTYRAPASMGRLETVSNPPNASATAMNRSAVWRFH